MNPDLLMERMKEKSLHEKYEREQAIILEAFEKFQAKSETAVGTVDHWFKEARGNKRKFFTLLK